MMMQSKWLYLPIDVRVREIESKTFLALQAASDGFNVVIGQKQKFPSILSVYPRGVYVGFAALSNLQYEYERFTKAGHKIVLMDEEGLVTHNEDIYIQNRLNTEVIKLTSLFAAWGQRQAEFLKQHRPDYMDKVIISGNPRFDILKPALRGLYAAEVEKLKARFGQFILINSNFGSCNHFSGGEKYLQSLKDKKIIRSAEEQNYFERYFAYRGRVMNEIIAALPQLRAAFPDTQIIIRPHPSENVETWKAHTAKLDNVFVMHEGPVIPWLLAAGVIIHNFCTTALEAFALGLAPIAYRPIIDESLETPLPTLASIEARSGQDLIEAVQYILSGGGDPERTQKIKNLGAYIANLEDGYSTDVLLERIKALMLNSSWRDGCAPALHAMRKTLEKIKAVATGQTKNSYVTHKFPGLEIEEIRALAIRMETRPGQYKDLRMKKIHDHCVLIKPA